MTLTSGGAEIRFESVGVRYAATERPALDDVTFAVPSGALTVLVGPSGGGKTTLLRTVNRLVAPTAGRVLVDGTDVASVPLEELRRGIGYAIQAVGLFPHYTVAQNVAVVPSLLHWPPDEITRRVDELLRLVHLDPARYRNRYPRELSGGEAQRAGVARAIASKPRILLMDEPFGAVDAIVRRSLQQELLAICKSLGSTILFVTHDVDEALQLADRVVVLKDGRVEQHGSVLDVMLRPATGYVRDLFRADDVLRRLRILRVGDAMRAGEAGGAPQIDADEPLLHALERFLQGERRLSVCTQGVAAGVLDLDLLRAAVLP